ncbi:MAG: phytanoyl-CoA dioxygenase family protein, partial [Candidatus Poribacteria bacterium]|nr:phytanoyl-CoA dioxygenase family protein [Candidatus Poribacteria bacterium]
DVVDSQRTMQFYEEFLGGRVITFDKRWLRCMAKGGHNHFHYDSVYVGRGTQNRYTMWSALTDIGLENGPLVICLGSHRHDRLKSTYGATDMDRDLTEAVFSTDPREMVEKFGFTLATAHFQPGDVIIFGLYMMHSSAPNRSDRYRISIDTRYQLAREEKDDRFFFREDGSWLGNFYNKGASYKPITELRREWGLD